MGLLSWVWNKEAPEQTMKPKSYADWFWNLFYVDEENDEEEEEAKRLRFEENLRIVNERVATMLKKDESSREDDVQVLTQKTGCCLRTGKITSLKEESGTIDITIHFERHNAPPDIQLHQFVSYLAYRASENNDWMVRKILPSEDALWVGEGAENEPSVGPQGDGNQGKLADIQKEMQFRSVLVKVTNRRGREIIVNDGEFQFNLDKITTSFTPVVGDFLYLDAVVEHDSQVADYGGAILDVERIRWVRYKVLCGMVAEALNAHGEGRIDNNVYFNRDSCTPGFVPCRGDQVNAECIESYQGKCTWRALIVSPMREPKKNVRINTNATALELQELFKPKSGISINASKLDFGTVIINEPASNVVTLIVTNTSSVLQVLMYGDFYSTLRESQVTPVKAIEKVTLLPGQTISYPFGCRGKYIGYSKELFVLGFKGFKVGFYFKVNVCDPDTQSMVSSEATTNSSDKYRKAMGRRTTVGKMVLRGVRPIIPPKFMAVRREAYIIPERYWKAVLDPAGGLKSVNEVKAALQELCPSLGTSLVFRNYREYFHSLLYLEEMDGILKTQQYDLETVLFQRAGEYLSLEVPGLAEKRPSLLVGDKVFASQPWKNDKLEFEGFIHKTFAKNVLIKFNNEFHLTYTQEVSNVRFEFSRTTIRRQHNAIEDAVDHLGETILFPTKLVLQAPQVELEEGTGDPNEASIVSHLYTIPDADRRTITWINTSLNYHQKEAVRNVLKGEARPLPYIIFGPPGTGKTITMVETILQILFLMPNSRLLVATPSNSSANLIAERLLDSDLLKPGDLVRLVGFHVLLEEGSLSERLRPYATTGILRDMKGAAAEAQIAGEGESLRESSNRNTVGRHRITVGTCIALGQLVLMDFPQGHFTHVVIDEAGQATEPEIHVPLSFLDRSGQAILAGDPLQLGPVVASTLAKCYGLGESYLDRLTHRFPYQRDTVGFPDTGGFDPRLVTRLVSNYRSLPEILALPNQLFYDSLLQPEVSADNGPDAELLTRLGTYLPVRSAQFGGRPPSILFHGVVGTNLQENDSPSWFNPEEAVTALTYLKIAYACNLRPEDVGVITPYRKQVQKMRWYFERHRMILPKIGSVEEFQGQERPVIIMSAVRSTRQHIETDVHHSLGFVASPKRLNVAITRARSLLVIIGNPHLLSADPYWRSAIRYCIEHKCYTGCELPINCLASPESEADDGQTIRYDAEDRMSCRRPAQVTDNKGRAESEW